MQRALIRLVEGKKKFKTEDEGDNQNHCTITKLTFKMYNREKLLNQKILETTCQCKATVLKTKAFGKMFALSHTS